MSLRMRYGIQEWDTEFRLNIHIYTPNDIVCLYTVYHRVIQPADSPKNPVTGDTMYDRNAGKLHFLHHVIINSL